MHDFALQKDKISCMAAMWKEHTPCLTGHIERCNIIHDFAMWEDHTSYLTFSCGKMKCHIYDNGL